MQGTPSLNKAKTECKRGHPLSGDNLYLRKNGKRECRACKILKQQSRRKQERQDNLSRFVTFV